MMIPSFDHKTYPRRGSDPTELIGFWRSRSASVDQSIVVAATAERARPLDRSMQDYERSAIKSVRWRA